MGLSNVRWAFLGFNKPKIYFRLIESEEDPVPKYKPFDHFNCIHFRIRYEGTAISIYFQINVIRTEFCASI